jgi:hypothetical protein
MEIPHARPVWLMRWFDRTSLAFFIAALVGMIGCFAQGRFAAAAATAASVLIFGCNWMGARHYSVSMQRWFNRHRK